jgi:hypothetical protein
MLPLGYAMKRRPGKYIIGDRPMTEEEWARERATVIDEKAVEELPEASPLLPKR